jgi:hypothetical protein
LIAAMQASGVRLLAGTDPVNPLVVPGFSLHDELERLVHAGLTPYQALRAATHDAAEALNAEGEFGTVAVGRRADLLLLEHDPLGDVAETRNIAGVMARGRWYPVADIANMLASVAEAFADGHAPFEGAPPLAGAEGRELSATYRVTWDGAEFGGERVWLGHSGDAPMLLLAERYDPHTGETFRVRIESDAEGAGVRMRLDGDGAAGRGHLDVLAQGPNSRLRGELLSGPSFELTRPVAAKAQFSADQFLAGYLLLKRRVAALATGDGVEVPVAEAALGSSAKLQPKTWRVTRLSDGAGTPPVLRFEIKAEHDPTSVLSLDAAGVVSFEMKVFGSTLRYQRLP